MLNEAQEATENVQEQRPGQLPRIMSRQMAIYYSNCAMVATTPKDISLVFGRYAPANNQQAEQTMAELYERHIYMTVEQAEELTKTLTKTLEIIKSKEKLQFGLRLNFSGLFRLHFTENLSPIRQILRLDKECNASEHL
jgi:hypothetical protein